MSLRSLRRDESSGFVPAIREIRLTQDGPVLLGCRCTDCNQKYLEEPMQCLRCFGSNLEQFAIGGAGKIDSYTVVFRSFRGIKTPFVMVLVKTDDGICLRGNIADADVDDMPVLFGARVKLSFVDTGQTDRDGRRFLAYAFTLDGEKRR